MTHRAEQEKEGQAMRPTGGISGPARTGWLVFAVLIVLVLLEYVAFLVLSTNLPIMLLMNVIDAALIMYYFMHLPRLWRREESEKEEGA